MLSTCKHSCLRSSFVVLAALLIGVAGCGGDFSPTAPTFPDPAGGAAFGSQSLSAISGQLLGGGSSAAAALGSAPGTSSMGGVHVSVPGTSLSTTTDGSGAFLLVGVPDGNVVLQFSGNGTNATLTLNGVGANQLIVITIQVQDTTASVVNQTVESLTEFEDDVDSVDGATLSFTLEDGTTIHTDANTWWDTGGDVHSFADLAAQHAAGFKVSVEGLIAPTATGAWLATVVKAELEELTVDDFELELSRDKWSLGWIDNGSAGQGNSAIEAWVEDGPIAAIDPASIELHGPDGFVVPFATALEGDRFIARFTKAQVISIAASVPPDEEVDVFLRGTLFDGTPFELVAEVEIVDDDDDEDDEDDDGNKIDPAVAAQAIADIQVVIDYLNGLVASGRMAANNAKPLINKLESVIAKLQKLNGTPAINQLEAFLNQLDAFADTGKIPEDDADFIEDLVDDIIDLLESDD